jgi:hypothetical protein
MLEFSPHVTAIVGLNNHGKSAVFRACRKILRDYPDGILFIREKQKYSSIEITTDSGVIERIVRKDKSSDSNVYKVDGVQFTKFGKTGIPAEVLNKLEVSSLQKFGDVEFDINFQHQLDPLFLISGDGLASIRGKVIGRVSGVDYAERAVQMASAELKSINRDIDQNVIDTKQNEEKLARYETIPELIEQLTYVDSLQEKQDDADREIDNFIVIKNDLINIISEATFVSNKIKLLDIDIYTSYEEISRINGLIDSIVYCIDIKEQMESADKMSAIKVPCIDDVESINKNIILVDSVISIKQNLDRLGNIGEINIPNIKSVESAEDRVRQLVVKMGELEKLSEDLNEIQHKVGEVEANLDLNEEKFNKLKDDLGVCPICDRPFDHEKES